MAVPLSHFADQFYTNLEYLDLQYFPVNLEDYEGTRYALSLWPSPKGHCHAACCCRRRPPMPPAGTAAASTQPVPTSTRVSGTTTGSTAAACARRMRATNTLVSLEKGEVGNGVFVVGKRWLWSAA